MNPDRALTPNHQDPYTCTAESCLRNHCKVEPLHTMKNSYHTERSPSHSSCSKLQVFTEASLYLWETPTYGLITGSSSIRVPSLIGDSQQLCMRMCKAKLLIWQTRIPVGSYATQHELFCYLLSVQFHKMTDKHPHVHHPAEANCLLQAGSAPLSC